MRLYLIGLLGCTLAAAACAEVSLVILKTPIRVVASYEQPEYEGADCGLFTVTLSVSAGKTTSSEESLPLRCGKARESVQTQVRKLVSWRPPYLALRTYCGMSNGWNCDTRAIYAYREGKLTSLGRVNDFLDPAKPTLFRKYYTVVEYNDLVAHGGERVSLVLRDAGAALAFDADETWSLNRETYDRFAARELKCNPKKSGCDDGFKVALVFNSTIAKLTGRQTELQSLLASARSRLKAEELQQLDDLLVQVDAQGVIKHMNEESY